MFTNLNKGAQRIVSLITGGGTGIGAATARLLGQQGHRIIISYNKSLEQAITTAKACEQMGAEVFLCQADISNPHECRRLVDQSLAHWGRVDHLVNNAGATVFADYQDYQKFLLEDYEKLMKINLYGPYLLSTLFAPHMEKQGQGAITNISSMAGITGQGSSIAYAVTKGALNTQTLALAKAFAPTVRVNAICPGIVASSWWHSRFPDEGKFLLFQKKQKENSPIHRVLTPEDVAKTILYIYENDHITGQLLQLNAGNHLGSNPPPKQNKTEKNAEPNPCVPPNQKCSK